MLLALEVLYTYTNCSIPRIVSGYAFIVFFNGTERIASRVQCTESKAAKDEEGNCATAYRSVGLHRGYQYLGRLER